MTLAEGTRLGPYEVLSLLGTGGMGAVYRARDLRLGREVAVKILLPRPDAQRLARFEREARALSALSHPHVLSVFDVGSQEGRPYLVTELLDGQTLRARLDEGPLPLRKALDYARQMAQGLAAAHERGLIHRDLKPANVIITRDGQVKILDFGLARLQAEEERPEETSDDEATHDDLTAGRVLGTAGYMAPEQIRGETLDARCDIFSFGVMLHEMVTGKRAFRGPTTVETLNAILHEDPPLLRDANPGLPAPLVRLIGHCLEKVPAERFQSARDLAFQLGNLVDLTTGSEAAPPKRVPRPRPRWLWPALALLAALAIGAVLHALSSNTSPAAVPTLTRLTFRRGIIESARFSSDGQTIVYGGQWDGAAPEVFTARRGSPESRALGFTEAEVLALSRGGEMAMLRDRRRLGTYVVTGTLAQAPLAGGAPRDVHEDVIEADWTADGRALSIVRRVEGRSRLERPRGQVLYETPGWISHHRNAPSGEAVAFIDHPVWGDDAGNVMIADGRGPARALSRDWSSLQGLAWSPDGREIWFTATRDGSGRAVHAVTLAGRERALCRMAGTLLLHDVHPGGQLLLSHQVLRREVRGTAGGDGEIDLSWLDYSFPADLSDDGTTLFFAENAEGGGPGYSAYVRRTDGSPAVRLGTGAALALSPDGRRVLVGQSYTTDAQQLVLIPTGAGETQTLPASGLRTYAASFFPDGRRLLLAANEPGQATRTYVQALDGTGPRALADGSFALSARPISPDGRWVALRTAEGRHEILPAEGGAARPLAGATADDQVIRWSADGLFIFVYKPGQRPAQIDRIELATGRREPWKTLRPADGAGVVTVTPVLISADGRRYAYGYRRVLSDLYVVDGVR